ncbi:hypothetical protein M422DRAFT_784609 [Sphaerobolus stellatus SS14]|uniref:Unplaced genomic scaffold SPHSTscaffold_237, whole genome shotgun sequence n=1 Tax=Sphaerobolus stellatus (strain SS14) TaxID=990650 RepID=A0A0C9US78_SPHS4|nr:hypothetical protein M422DRAFT_784609 [Sphaerobolus stellatus SS14]
MSLAAMWRETKLQSTNAIVPPSLVDYELTALKIANNAHEVEKFRKVLKGALNGNCDMIEKLSEVHQAAPSLWEAVLFVLIHHLQSVTDSDLVSDSSRFIDRELVISNLSQFIKFIIRYPPGMDLTRMMKAALPKIIQAFTLIFKYESEHASDHPSRHSRSSSEVIELLTQSFVLIPSVNGPNMRDIDIQLAATPGSIELAIKFWMDDGPWGTDPNCKPLKILGYLIALRHVKTVDVQEFLDRVLDGIGDNLTRFGEVTARRLASVFEMLQIDQGPVRLIIDDILQFMSIRDHPVHLALLEAGVIQGLSAFFTKCMTRMPKTADDIDFECGMAAFKTVMFHIEDTTSIPWIIEAVQGGIIHGILHLITYTPFLRRLTPFWRSGVVRLIDIIIPRYLAYRSVLIPVFEAVRKLDHQRLERMKETVFEEAWTRLTCITLGRMEILLSCPPLPPSEKKCTNDMVGPQLLLIIDV